MRKLTIIIAFLMVGCLFVQAQTVRITGTVTGSQDGLTIPGVSVLVKGTNVGVTTDLDGKYTLNTPANATTVVFSFVGMKAQEIEIGGRAIIDVVLESESVQVEELVVVGYGVQKKREVTGSITQVKGESLASLATPSFESQLAGRSAGVQVTTSSGIVGEAPRVRIRGIGSLSQGTYPLVVVDGIPIFTGDLGGYASNNALGDINPADIESVEILKDGSATAIYGSRASNGVILITTKKGAKGKVSVTYNNYFGVASPVGLFSLLKTKDFITIQNEKRTNAGLSIIAIGDEYDTDWQAAVLRKRALQQDHALSLSGSSDQTNYYFSLGYTKLEGVNLPNEMNRYTFRANVDQKVKNWLSLGTNASIARSEYFGMNTGTGSLSGNVFSAIRQLPNTPVYDPLDPTGYNIDDASKSVVGRWLNAVPISDNLPNIRYTLDKNVQTSKIFHTIASTYALVKILPYLNFKTQLGVDNVGTEGFMYLNSVQGDGYGKGIVENNFQNLTRWNVQNVISFNKSFAEKHNVAIVLVNEFQKQRVNSFYGGGSVLSTDFFNQNVTTGSYTTQTSGGSLTENGFISYAVRANYNYAGKYFFQASVRRDGISSLPKANRYGMFPGASIGWTVSKESFMSAIPIISDLKLRASYAEVGNVDIGNYPYLGLYGAAKYADYNGLAFMQMGNDQLKWETSKKTDVGMDVAVMDNKIRLTFDYYINNQDGLILAVPTPPSMGIPFNQVSKNVGSMKNWGYEFSLEGSILNTKDFSLSADFNLTLAQSKVKTLVNHQDLIGTFTIIREGESRLAIYGYDYRGVNMANGNPIYAKADGSLVQGNISSSPSYFVYDPANPTVMTTAATLAAADKKILGNALPTYYGSFGIKARYTGFDLSVMFRYSGGNKIMNRTRQDLMNMKFQNNGTEILGRWQSVAEPGDGKTPRLWTAGDNFINIPDQSSTRWVESGNFVKLQTIQIGYTLPKAWVSKVGINNLRVFAQGQDIFVITKYSGIDPEMETSGTDFNGSPRQRTITFGLSMSL